jgi:hypothetical protein
VDYHSCVGLLNSQALKDTDADRLRESLEVPGIPFAFTKATSVNEVGRVGDEASVVVSEIAPGHVAVVLGTLEDTLKVSSGVTAVVVQVGVETENVSLELGESRGVGSSNG